jgi:hypothetical protein
LAFWSAFWLALCLPVIATVKQAFNTMNKTFLIWAAVGGVASYYWLSSSTTAWQVPGINQIYNLGWNFGNSGTLSASN